VYLMWSCVQTTASGYVVMAIFGDRRAYGLRPLRYLLPALYASAVAAAIIYWFPYHLLTVILVALGFAAIGAYGGYVFWHTFRMAVPHRPREAVVRPMYTLISVTVHVLLVLYMGLVAVVVTHPGGGTALRADFYDPSLPPVEMLPTPKMVEPIEPVPDPDVEPIDPELEPMQIIPIPPDPSLPEMVVPTEPRERLSRPQRHQRPNAMKWRSDLNRPRERTGEPLEAEPAVLRALRWLKAHQNEEGSWGEAPIQPAMTGLALLCFLGHGEDNLSPEFGSTVRAAMIWFVSQQDEDGFFCGDHRWAYQHGIATYAMAEAYAMTGIEDLKPAVAKAVRRICDGQTPDGGWYYGYGKLAEDGSPKRGGDTSVSGWQIQALTAARGGGIRFPNKVLQYTLLRAVEDLKSRFSLESGFGYTGIAPNRSKEQNYCTTAIGTLCLEFLGQHNTPEVRGGLKLMHRYSCDWDRTSGGAFGPLYGWYYTTQAMWHASADPQKNRYWRYWNPLFSRMLLRRQESDGHWEYPANDGGQRESQHFPGKNRLVYSTAMCCLMLEVYYRYLPTYKVLQ